MGKLGTKAVKGTLYVGISRYIIGFLGFAVNIVLARYWLKPADFGIFAVAESVFAYIFIVRGMGHDYAFRSWSGDLARAANAHRWLTMMLSFVVLGVSVVYFVFSGSESVVRWILLYMGLCGVLEGMTSTYHQLFEKELLYKNLTIIGLINQLVKYGVTVVAAYKGYREFSLVFGLVSSTLLKFLMISFVSPFKVRFKYDREIIRDYFNFGPYWHYYITVVGSTTVSQLANLIVNRIAGKANVGYYVKALGQARLPTAHVTHVLGSTALSTYCKVQDDREELSRAFSLLLRFIIRTSIPVSVLLLINAREMILLLFKEPWAPVIPVFYFLSLYCLLRPIYDDCGALYASVKRMKLINNISLIQAGTLILSMPVLAYSLKGWNFMGADGSVIGAAISMDLALLVGVVLAYSRIREYVDIAYFRTFVPPVVAGLIAGGAAVLLWEGVAEIQGVFIEIAEFIFNAFASGVYMVFGKALDFRIHEKIWLGGLIFKASAMILLYIGLLILMEGRELKREMLYVWAQFRGNKVPRPDESQNNEG